MSSIGFITRRDRHGDMLSRSSEEALADSDWEWDQRTPPATWKAAAAAKTCFMPGLHLSRKLYQVPMLGKRNMENQPCYVSIGCSEREHYIPLYHLHMPILPPFLWKHHSLRKYFAFQTPSRCQLPGYSTHFWSFSPYLLFTLSISDKIQ